MPRQKRDYRAEYQRRIARGVAKGLSRSQARGHPRAVAEPQGATRTIIFDDQLEAGLGAIRRGKSLTATARALKVSPERLRTYIKAFPFVEKRRGRYVVGPDSRPRRVVFYSNGRLVKATVAGHEPARLAGAYINAVGEFLRTNDTGHLAPFVGAHITDIGGKRYPLETRPNQLYRLHAAGGDTFEQIYRIVV